MFDVKVEEKPIEGLLKGADVTCISCTIQEPF